MNSVDQFAKTLNKLIEDRENRKPSAADDRVTVTKVEGDTVWVHFPGGVDETPVQKTIDAKVGDVVTVRRSDGRAWITGNSTNPPTDDSTANYAVDLSTNVKKEVTVLNTVVTENIEATNARFNNVEADTAKVHNLTADQLSATVGYIGDLTADNITASDISAATGYIDDLTTGNITAQNIIADHSTVGSLDANYAHISNGVIDNATIGYADVNGLNANYAQVNLANVNNAWIQNGVVKDAAISDAQIIGVSANKLTAGTIDASNITVTNLNASNITTGSITVDGITIDVANNEASIDGSYIEDGTITLNGLAQEVTDKIDGAIETFTGTVVPTLNNYPYTDWYNASATPVHDERASHVGDVYYVINAGNDADGYCYRFAKDGNTYKWVLIKDSDVTAALGRLTTAEGNISGLKTFESETSAWITDTDEALSSLKTRTSNLETDMGDKVSTSTFNELSQTVDENSTNITSLSTITTNNGLTSTTNISNTVNNVSQKANANESKITNLTTLLQTNADGTTASTDIVHQVSQIDQDLDGITTRVGKTEVQILGQYATSTTAKGTAAKVATITPAVSNWELYKGATITVKFTNENTATTPTLNINSTGAKPIRNYSAGTLTEAEYKWKAGSTFTFTYNDTYWLMQDATVSTRINSAESSISLNTENIELKVSKNGVISSINQSSETVKIKASKVEIDGTAIFNAISSDVDSAITGKGYQTASDVSTAIAGKADKSAAIAEEQRIYYRSNVATKPNGNGLPTAWVTETGDKYNTNATTASGWSRKVTPIANGTGASVTKYLYLWTCIQKKTVSGTVTYGDILLDDSTTVIDGGKIVTGSVSANAVSASSGTFDIANIPNLTAEKIKTNVISAINDSANEGVTINADRVAIDGTTIFNTISGDVTDAISDAVNDIEIGGRNLLRNTRDYYDYRLGASTDETAPTISSGEPTYIIVYPEIVSDTTKQQWAISNKRIPYSIIRNKTLVFSAYYKAENGGVFSYQPSIDLYAEAEYGGTRCAASNFGFTITGTGNWEKVSHVVTITDDWFNDKGILTDYSDAYAQFGLYRRYHPTTCPYKGVVQLKETKWEIGNIATSWTPAPEDIQAEIDAKKSTHTVTGADSDASAAYATILGWNERTLTYTVDSSSGIKVGDTVRVKVLVSNFTGTPPVYVVGTATAIPSSTQVTMTAHGIDTTIIDGGNILTNSITASQIAANTITANNIRIGDYNNYITVTENDEESLISGVISDGWIYKNTTATSFWLSPVLNQWASSGEKYRITGVVKAPSAGKIYINVCGRNASGTSTANAGTGAITIAANTETSIDSIITITDAVAACPKVNIYIQFFDSNSTAQMGYCKQMKCERMTGGSLIVDGSITADKIGANAITIGKINQSDSSTASAILNSNIEIGGRNLVRQTQRMTDWAIGSGATVVADTDYNYATLIGSASNWNSYFSSRPTLDLELLDGNPMILSFEYKATAAWTLTTAGSFICAGSATAAGSSSGSRTKYGKMLPDNTTLPATSEWTRASLVTLGLTPSMLTDGSGDVNSWYLQLYLHINDITVSIRKIKLEKGNKATDWTPAPEDVQAEIDAKTSKNLLGATANLTVPTGGNSAATSTFGTIGRYNSPQSEFSTESYDGYANSMVITSSVTGNRGVCWYTTAGAITAGETYTFSCKVKASVAVSVHTHTAWRNGSATAAYTGWTSGGAQTLTANTWTDYSYTFTPASDAQLDWEFLVAICFTGSTSGVTLYVAHAKFEKGETATDWTPALGDGSLTATNYITSIDNTGITVHPYDSSGNDYLRIASDNISIYRNGNLRSQFQDDWLMLGNASGTRITAGVGTSPYIYMNANNAQCFRADSTGVVVGNGSTNYTKVTTDGMQVYQGGSSVAEFGSTARIGKNEAAHVEIQPSSLVMSDGIRTIYEVAQSSTTVRMTRNYGMSFGYENEGYQENISLGRHASSWGTFILTYKVNGGNTQTATWNSTFPDTSESNTKYGIQVWQDGYDDTAIGVSIGTGNSATESDVVTIISLTFTFITSEQVVESTLGAYADKTYSGAFRIGKGTSTSNLANGLLVDWAGNAMLGGDVLVNCENDSSGGMSLTRPIRASYELVNTSTTFLELDVYQVGMLVNIGITFQKTSSTSSGSNLFNIALTNAHIPVPIIDKSIMGSSYYGNNAIGIRMFFDEDGTYEWRMHIRNASNAAVTVTQFGYSSLCYIWDGLGYTDDAEYSDSGD